MKTITLSSLFLSIMLASGFAMAEAPLAPGPNDIGQQIDNIRPGAPENRDLHQRPHHKGDKHHGHKKHHCKDKHKHHEQRRAEFHKCIHNMPDSATVGELKAQCFRDPHKDHNFRGQVDPRGIPEGQTPPQQVPTQQVGKPPIHRELNAQGNPPQQVPIKQVPKPPIHQNPNSNDGITRP